MTAQEFTTRMNQVSVRLMAYAVSLTGQQADAEDLYQDAVLRAYERLDYYRVDGNFDAWIFRILRNLFINEVRKKAKYTVLYDYSHDQYLLNSKAAVFNEGEERLRQADLLHCLNHIKPRFRRPIRLFYKGYKYREIAVILNESENTVKLLIFRGRQQAKAIRHKINDSL